MNKNYMFFFFFFGWYCNAVSAEDIKIQLNGSILEQSCNVKSSDLVKNINFNDINPLDFAAVGATTSPMKVSITLENCTGKVGNMSYMFSGVSDDSNPDLLKVTGKSGITSEAISSGLAIEILDMNKKHVPLNSKKTIDNTIFTSNYDFIFFLRYKSTAKNIVVGDASSLLYLDFYYE